MAEVSKSPEMICTARSDRRRWRARAYDRNVAKASSTEVSQRSARMPLTCSMMIRLLRAFSSWRSLRRLRQGALLEDRDGGHVGEGLGEGEVVGAEVVRGGLEQVERADDPAAQSQRQGVGGHRSRFE